jgi:hypothetical protein
MLDPPLYLTYMSRYRIGVVWLICTLVQIASGRVTANRWNLERFYYNKTHNPRHNTCWYVYVNADSTRLRAILSRGIGIGNRTVSEVMDDRANEIRPLHPVR